MSRFLLAVLVLTLAAACGEKAPRPDPERSARYNAEKGPNAMAERTRRQSEAERMGD